MTGNTFCFSFSDLSLCASDIEDLMGYKKGDDKELVTGIVGEVLKESGEICDIRAQYMVFSDIRFDKGSSSLIINDIVFQVERIVFNQIRKSESVAIFLCTAGPEIGIRSRKAMKGGDLLRGYVLDVVGSGIAESAADLLQNELKNEVAAAGLKITNRYSPGYCGWNVAEQHRLFQLIPYNYCGIQLTESALMYPVKSVSGIIGIGKEVNLNPYACNMCVMEDCIYRGMKM